MAQPPRPALVIQPPAGASEPPVEQRIKPVERLRRVFSYTRPYTGRLIAALVCLVIASGLGLVYPYYFGALAEAAFTNASTADTEAAYRELGDSTVLLLAVFLAQAVFVFFRHYLMTWLGERVTAGRVSVATVSSGPVRSDILDSP